MNCIQSLINICIYIKETNWNYYYKYICICKRNIFQNEIPLCYIALLDCHIWSIFVRRFIEPLFYRFEYRFLFGKLLNEIGWIQWNLFIGIPNLCIYKPLTISSICIKKPVKIWSGYKESQAPKSLSGLILFSIEYLT